LFAAGFAEHDQADFHLNNGAASHICKGGSETRRYGDGEMLTLHPLPKSRRDAAATYNRPYFFRFSSRVLRLMPRTSAQ
jgi:hypothetical protein